MTNLFFSLMQFPMLVLVLDLNGLYSLQLELTTSEMPSRFPEFLALLSFSDVKVFANIYFTKFLPVSSRKTHPHCPLVCIVQSWTDTLLSWSKAIPWHISLFGVIDVYFIVIVIGVRFLLLFCNLNTNYFVKGDFVCRVAWLIAPAGNCSVRSCCLRPPLDQRICRGIL